jgi:hypothetical protein
VVRAFRAEFLGEGETETDAETEIDLDEAAA